MDKIPDEDEEFETSVDGYHFKVLTVKNKMIQSVLVTKLSEGDASAEDETALEEEAQ